jgi:hypothetical protein
MAARTNPFARSQCMSRCVHSPRARVRNRAVREFSPRCPWAYRLRRHLGTCQRGFLFSVCASGARAMLRRRLKAAPTHASRRRQLLAALVSRLTQKKHCESQPSAFKNLLTSVYKSLEHGLFRFTYAAVHAVLMNWTERPVTECTDIDFFACATHSPLWSYRELSQPRSHGTLNSARTPPISLVFFRTHERRLSATKRR